MKNFARISRPFRETTTAILALAGLAAAWLPGRGENPGPLGFRLDDAWIHMVYGRGLLENGFLAYAPGVPSTGCTSPLWAVLLAGLHALIGRGAGPDAIVPAVLVTGALLQIAAVLVAADLARRSGASDLAGVVGGGLVALAMPWTAAAFSGMEVTLTGLLLLLGVRAASRSAGWAAGVWLALAGLARPEAAVVTGVVAAGTVIAGARARRRGAKPASAPNPLGELAPLLVPSLIAGTAFVGYDLWASGAPLPATFYAKSSANLYDLPRRFGVALTRLFPGIPPFAAGLGWLALIGCFGRGAGRSRLPLAAGAAYLLANLLLIDPADPPAFYHLRYVLPAVPLLLVALTLGAARLGERLPARSAAMPLLVLLALTGVGAGMRAGPVSRHLHNDVRNINEVQRAIGERLGASLRPGTWIAASDAGAIRYFSRLPTVDVVGLNTPEMLEGDEEFVRSHPVAALAFLPAWFRPVEADALEPVFRATTERYTVTGNPSMARQVVVRAAPGASGDGSPVRVRFVGFHPFALTFRPNAP